MDSIPALQFGTKTALPAPLQSLHRCLLFRWLLFQQLQCSPETPTQPNLLQLLQSLMPLLNRPMAQSRLQSRHAVPSNMRQVALPQDLAQPQVIEVPANYETVQIHFRTASSPLSVRQSHIPAPVAPVEHTSFQDNAHRLVHEVMKPVIQEVREVIQPYRRVTQEIRPVIEEVHTIVHKGDRLVQAPLPLRDGSPSLWCRSRYCCQRRIQSSESRISFKTIN